MKLILPTLLLLGFGCHPPQQHQCIDPARVNPGIVCTMQYEPVCGCDRKTYGNACEAERAGLLSWTQGACAPGKEF